MFAEIITIGDEILIGQIVDTNSAWLAQQLSMIGFQIKRKTSVGDLKPEITHALEEAQQRAKLVLITGGLGPTRDDITKNVLFEYFHSTPIIDQSVLQKVKDFLAQRNVAMNDLNEKQALVADNCIVIPNEIGTAPGMWFEKNETVFVCMPGVPFEMQHIMEKYLIEKIRKHFKTPAIFHKNILTTGIGESSLAKLIEPWEDALPPHMKLAYLPSPGIVRLRISAIGSDITIIQQEVQQETAKLQARISKFIFGYDDDTLESIVGKLLLERKKTLSVAESCTGGNIGYAITSNPGSSAYFKGGIIAYANEIKTRFLNVSNETLKVNGAVSEEVVRMMANEVRQRFDTDYAIAISGVAGPGGGTVEKPVGTTWIAVASANQCISQKFLFGEHRGRNVSKATIAALNMLRKMILER